MSEVIIIINIQNVLELKEITEFQNVLIKRINTIPKCTYQNILVYLSHRVPTMYKMKCTIIKKNL